MSDSEEVEEFGVNEEDLRRAFNPGSNSRGSNKMSKEEAMLGIWANQKRNNSSDENDSDDEMNNKFNYASQKKRSSTINFVSSKSSEWAATEERRKESEKSKSKQNQDDAEDQDYHISDVDEDIGSEEEGSNEVVSLNI